VTSRHRPASLRELPGRYFWRAAWPTLVATTAGAAVAQASEGGAAAAGALVGGVIVLVFFGLDLLVMRMTAGWDPAATFMIVMLEYVGKIIALAILLVGLREQEAIDPRWVGIGVAIATTVFLVALVIAYLRIPTFVVEPAVETPEKEGPAAT
jgi:ATP synthase protein I